MKTAEIAETHGRSVMSVRLVARSPGTSYHQKWSEQEWQLLTGNSHLPLDELTALFPGRTQASVRKALMRLKNSLAVVE